jgi:uncharacterized membrane protein
MKLFYAYSEKDFKEIERMKELLQKFLNGKISKEEFDREMKNIRQRQQSLV